MTEQEAPVAMITLDTAWRYVDASPTALELLGVTLAELRSSERDRFALRADGDAEETAMRARWEAGGAQPLAGTTGLRRADGTAIRVSYTLERIDTGFRTRIWEVEGAPEAPSTVLSVGDVLREWRAAERALAELAPGSPELARMLNEIGLLRSQYQQLFRAAEPATDR